MILRRLAFTLNLPLLLFASLLTPATCLAQQNEGQSWKGYVTAGSTLAAFDVNALRVVVLPGTTVGIRNASGTTFQRPVTAVPALGQQVEVFGKIDRKRHTVVADKIVFQELQPRDVNGEGVVETSIHAFNGSPDDHLVRVDGYSVLVTTQTAKDYRAPLTSSSAIQPNTWMTFHGHQRLDGIVVADKLALDDNGISKREEKLLSKSVYDPGAVDKNTNQGTLSKAFRGIDPKQIPPYDDPAMQARVEAIGAKLIPQYQRGLSPDDDRKIDFQFQVIDLKKWRRDAHTLPNGIILVPVQVIERLQNDSQLATVLADNIACALEKQDYRAQPANASRGAVNIAGSVAGLFVPGLGLLTGGGTSIAAAKALRLREEQSGRVSLFLLNDAGYKIDQAPLAWWLLASSKPREPAEINLPWRAAYLYDSIAHTWHPQD